MLSYLIFHPYHSTPSTPISKIPNFNQLHLFLRPSSYWHATLAPSPRTLPLHCHLRRLAASFAPLGGASVLGLLRISSTRSPTNSLPLRTLFLRKSNTITDPTISLSNYDDPLIYDYIPLPQ